MTVHPQSPRPNLPRVKNTDPAAAAAEDPETPWKVLGKLSLFNGPDHKSWWDNTAPVIGISLKRMNYSIEDQYKHLLLVNSIFRTIGPYPNEDRSNLHWPCLMPGTGEALNVSFNFQGDTRCTLRAAVEPIGPYAGTEHDPANENSQRQLLEMLRQVRNDIDLGWFHDFDKELAVSNDEARQHWDSIKHIKHKSQKLVAFDFHEGSFTVKPYFVPLLKSVSTGAHPLRLIVDSVKRQCGARGLDLKLSKIDDYVIQTKYAFMPERTVLSFDCNKPDQTRIKIYTAAIGTSVQDAYDVWTLGGRLEGLHIDKGFELVKKAWCLFHPNDEYVAFNINWELAPNDPNPAPKAYFRVYDEYVDHVTNALVALFADLGWNDHTRTHQTIQQEAYPTLDFKASRHLYSWISVAYYSTVGPYITIYNNPIMGI